MTNTNNNDTQSELAMQAIDHAATTLLEVAPRGSRVDVVEIVGTFLRVFVDAGAVTGHEVLEHLAHRVELEHDERAALVAGLKSLPEVSLVDGVRYALRSWCEPGEVYELRALGAANSDERRTIAGYYDDAERAAQAAAELSGHSKGVYMTLNPVNRALVRRAPNELFRPGLGELTSAHAIVQRHWMLIDCDPSRPKALQTQSATDKEKLAAFLKAFVVWHWLWARGLPHPVIADSGNGVHLRYKVDLPADDDTVGSVLDALSSAFSDDSVSVDTAVRDPNRICKLYGTMACKGTNTIERPHRASRVLFVPASISVVPAEALKSLPPSLGTRGRSKDTSGSRRSPGQNGPSFQEAVEKYNEDHPLDLPVSNGRCQICEHNGCFGRHPDNDQTWICFSDNHEGAGRKATSKNIACWHGDALDLEANRRGLSRAGLLRQEGYLPNPSSSGPHRPPRPDSAHGPTASSADHGHDEDATVHNVAAESAFLRSLVSGSARNMEPEVEVVQPDDFFLPLHADIFGAVRRRIERGESVDVVTIIDDMKGVVGGIEPVIAFFEAPEPRGEIREYAKIVVRDAAIRRDALHKARIANALRDHLRDSTLVGTELAVSVINLASELATASPDDHRLHTASIACGWEDIARRLVARSEGNERPITMPWPRLNEAIGGGLWPGIYILVGGTGTHKTGFACQLGLHAAQEGVPVLYVSLEMDALDLQSRFFGLLSGEYWSALQTGRLEGSRVRQVSQTFGPVLQGLPFRATYLSPRSQDAATELSNSIIEMRRLYPQKRRGERPFLVIFDFLQLVGGDPREDLRTRIGNAAYAAQELARKLDAAVLLLSSTSRENYKFIDDAGPTTKSPSSLVGTGKESGELEYSADAVLTLRPRPSEGGTPSADAKIIDVALAKVRLGIPSWQSLKYVRGRLEEADTERNAPRGGAPRARNHYDIEDLL